MATRHFGCARAPRSTGRASGSRCPPASGVKRRAFRPDAIVAQSPFEAAAALLARTGVPVIVELHGDWRTFGRLYGSAARRRARARGRRGRHLGGAHAAKVRAVSPYTERLAREAGREPGRDVSRVHGPGAVRRAAEAAAGAAASRCSSACSSPTRTSTGSPRRGGSPGRTPSCASSARARAPTSSPRSSATGSRPGSRSSRLPRSCARSTRRRRSILPSRSEGMGRVVIEAQLRGRPVLGSNVGGIPDLVTDGVDGVLVRARRPTRSPPRCGVLDDRARARAARRERARSGRALARLARRVRGADAGAGRVDEARRRHPARRPRRSRARRDGADAAARSPSGSTSSSC